MAQSTTCHSDDRTRFTRMALVIIEELIPLLQDVLKMKIPPNRIHREVLQHESVYKMLGTNQTLLIQNAQNDGYKEFDITLTYTLLRNLQCLNVTAPTQGWGTSQMPGNGETTLGDDIERIRLIRNNVYGHVTVASLSQTEFQEHWSNISDICTRMDPLLGTNYVQRLQKAEVCAIDQTMESTLLGKIRNLCSAEQSMRELLEGVIRVRALHWILSPEAPIQQPPVPLLEDLLLSEDFLHVNDQEKWLRQQLKVTSHIIETTVEKTKGQRTNALKAAVRKLRITASNFGQVLRAVRLKRISKLEKCAAIAWGMTNEKTAAEKCTVLGASVHETGLWLHESGVIGASPDGIVNHQQCCPPDILHFQSEAAKYLKPDLIEVKCPYSARNMKIADAVEVVKEFLYARL